MRSPADFRLVLRVDRDRRRVRFYLNLDDEGTEIPVPLGEDPLEVAHKLASWMRSSGQDVSILQEGVRPSEG